MYILRSYTVNIRFSFCCAEFGQKKTLLIKKETIFTMRKYFRDHTS